MDINEINKLKDIIENTSGVEFAPFGEGTNDFWITKAEQRLSFSFPESFKWWLKNYGGGEVFGEEIFSIYELDFDNVIGGDIVYINELNRQNNVTNANQLTICEGDFGMFYFQRDSKDSEECPVMLNGSLYARDFIEFLIKFISS
ncbi:TPA: SMI1/KNR4 family protein [Streptococcus suis]|uniref:SMI1/KNR4 family protein n=1 Tax=Streptococcus suis TaxID=1307 RepID=UPI00240F91F4|nr:SMI1/KNR4 family protein [Streptococcus suis]MDG3137308.1 SMI1/KNR4 family protein [Streptococcus suis]HEM3613028.1 SMI1/KNR4 family protein [Streptococcus suis]HEM3615426.1 SMI1/KNR4 family protein [Streptococcus suis]HEM3627625.1 SMI1/KNR4 family protein [Streptococcus suis]HEM3640756.1 SMI1/KNR4 family protein [Streptococcus suis]